MIDLKEIFKSSEKVNVEVKAAQGGIPNSVWETYSSFANTFGGTIILGIGEDKETKKFIPVGVSEPQKMLSDIWNTLNNRQKISANILLEHHVYVAECDGLDYQGEKQSMQDRVASLEEDRRRMDKDIAMFIEMEKDLDQFLKTHSNHAELIDKFVERVFVSGTERMEIRFKCDDIFKRVCAVMERSEDA